MPKSPRVGIMLDLQWPYKRHSGVLAGALQFAQEQGWETLIDEYADDTLSRCKPGETPYDGVIARANKGLAYYARKFKIPVVNVWLSSPAWKQLPGVFPDSQAIGQLRAEHLLARGFRNFAALVPDHDRGQATELRTFIDAVEAKGCSCIAETVALDESATVQAWRNAERTIAAWMERWKLPVGVFLGRETHGRMVAQMCRNRGWRVPGDVAIIAGWNEETFCTPLRPTLTSVEVGFENIGYTAAGVLARLMKGETLAEPHLYLQPQGLVVRESTDFYAVSDPLIAAALQFIASHSNQDIGPQDVAAAVTTEPRTLQRRFRKILDRPIATEIRRVRLERAKRELSQTRHSMKEIARDVGFGSAMRMYDIFCRELGMTPSEYRKQHKSLSQS